MGCCVGHSRDMFSGVALYALEEVILNIPLRINNNPRKTRSTLKIKKINSVLFVSFVGEKPGPSWEVITQWEK